MKTALILAYSGCSTCAKALAWLRAHDVTVEVRPIALEPPTRAELRRWVPASGLPGRKWLNTSGQSYRAMGKADTEGATDEMWLERLSADGKLVKRPVLVVDGGSGEGTVRVGFSPDAYAALFEHLA